MATPPISPFQRDLFHHLSRAFPKTPKDALLCLCEKVKVEFSKALPSEDFHFKEAFGTSEAPLYLATRAFQAAHAIDRGTLRYTIMDFAMTYFQIKPFKDKLLTHLRTVFPKVDQDVLLTLCGKIDAVFASHVPPKERSQIHVALYKIEKPMHVAAQECAKTGQIDLTQLLENIEIFAQSHFKISC